MLPSLSPSMQPSTGTPSQYLKYYLVFLKIFHLLRMTALCNTSNLKSSIASDIFVEMLFILDIMFNFRMTFVNEKGEVVEAGKDIALHYIKGNNTQ